MDTNAELNSIKDEVFREIGKNVVAFQMVEDLLKAPLGATRVEGGVGGFAAARERRMAESAKLTMGNLVGKFTEEILTTAPPDDADELVESHEPSISMSFRIEIDEGSHAKQTQALKTLVDERNELIHHFLPKWDWNSAESMGEALRYLITQRERTETHRTSLVGVGHAFDECTTEFASFFNSEEGRRQTKLLLLQQSPTVRLLCEFAKQSARADGYVAVASAREFVHTHAKDDILEMKKRYGFDGLLALIRGAELFEVMEEPTANGVRQMYRVI